MLPINRNHNGTTMNITQASWANIVFPLDGLAQTISAVNYTVQFETLSFNFDGSSEMTLENLQQLYPNYPVAGRLTKSTFIEAQQIVHYCLSYHVKGSNAEYDPKSEVAAIRAKYKNLKNDESRGVVWLTEQIRAEQFVFDN